MAFQATSNYYVDLIRQSTRRILKNLSAFEIQQKQLEFIEESGLRAKLVVRELESHEDRLSATGDISGGGSTLLKECWENALLDLYLKKRELGRAPVDINLIISDKTTSGAVNISDTFNKKRLVEGFEEWVEETFGIPKEEAVKGTDFRKTGKREHFDIRRKYDQHVRNLREELYPLLKEDMRNLRGRRLYITDGAIRRYVQINDTHPAPLDILDLISKKPLYTGLYSGPVGEMIKDSHKYFHASFIDVKPMRKFEEASTVDWGLLYGLSKPYYVANPTLDRKKEVQNIVKCVGDYVFNTMCAGGIPFPLMYAVTKDKHLVEYRSLTGKTIVVEQPLVIVGDKIKCGPNAWGRNLRKDLKDLETFLGV